MIAKEMSLPSRAVGSMHWTMEAEDMAARANVPVFQSHVSTSSSSVIWPQSSSTSLSAIAAAPSSCYQPQQQQHHYSSPYHHHEYNPSKSPTIAGSDSSLGPGTYAGSVGRHSDLATPDSRSAEERR